MSALGLPFGFLMIALAVGSMLSVNGWTVRVEPGRVSAAVYFVAAALFFMVAK